MLLKTKSKIAVVCARGLGDALLSLIISNNLQSSGYEVVTFSTILCEMSNWFPGLSIAPFEMMDLSAFDHVIAADHSSVFEENETTTILYERNFDRSKSMVENLLLVCKKLGIKAASYNGVVAPSELIQRKYPRRVVLHPSSADERKNWYPSRFRKVAKKLHKLGFDPILCVSPKERADWPDAKIFNTISDLASFIYESGFLIGNDSGPGHLASLLGIPTISLFARKSYARLWRPGWLPAYVVTPKIPLIGAPMKQRYWKNFLTTNQVIKNFKYLTNSI